MKTFIYKLFRLQHKQTSIRTELLAGATSFATIAYLMIVVPSILSEAGMDFQSSMLATVLASALSCFLLGIIGNYPFCLAPGLGLVAYFTYSVVQLEGLAWQQALGICFYSGCLLFLLNASRVSEKVMHAIPQSIRISTAAGIGLFLTFIGLKSAGVIIAHPQTLVAFGNPMSPSVFLTIFGVITIASLLKRHIRGAFLIGILLNWAIGLATGLVVWQGLVSTPDFSNSSFLDLDFSAIKNLETLGILLSFFFINLFDTSGTLMGLSEQAGLLNHRAELPKAHRALYSNALGTMGSAVLGAPPISFLVESASGIAEGGRSGLTPIVTGLLVLLSLFLFPLASSIPAFATSPVLIILGGLMLRSMTRINWDDASEFIPAFLVLVTIPLTYSIATGLGMGFISYPFIKVLCGKPKDVSLITWGLCALFLVIFLFL